jgi:hypothetical protein
MCDLHRRTLSNIEIADNWTFASQTRSLHLPLVASDQVQSRVGSTQAPDCPRQGSGSPSQQASQNTNFQEVETKGRVGPKMEDWKCAQELLSASL